MASVSRAQYLLALLALSPLLPGQKPPAAADWVLTFADEFNGSDLDLSRWSPHDPWGHARNRELQTWAPAAVSVRAGQLHLTASSDTATTDGRDYQSGIVTTFGTFSQLYGRFEVRFRVPPGGGLRPGFRLQAISGESIEAIDVFQSTGGEPTRISFANHWGTEQAERSFGDSFTGPDLTRGFHTVTVEWERNRISWSLDGQERFRSVDGVPQQPMFLLLDLAVGGNVAHAPDATTRFPASFDVDYIRVYRRK